MGRLRGAAYHSGLSLLSFTFRETDAHQANLHAQNQRRPSPALPGAVQQAPYRARSLGIAVGTVSRYIIRAKQADLGWPLPEELTDLELEQRLFAELAPPTRPVPNWEHVKRQLAPKGITLRLVWQKYRGHYPEGYGYSRFCKLYHAWRQRTNVRMHIEHKAGEKLYVDYSGKSVPIVDPRTGEVSKAQIFVAVLGYSSYTYVEATQNQKLSNWIGSHRRAFEFFGAAAQAVVPDNLRSAVKKAHRYDPETNLTFQELAEHYDVVILPTRVRKPRDNNLIENVIRPLVVGRKDYLFAGSHAAAHRWSILFSARASCTE